MKTLLLVLCLLFCVGCSSRDIIEASGEVERYEYLNGGWGTDDKTIIYFKDGTSYILSAQYPIPAKKIKIIKNGLDYRIEPY